MTAWALSAGLVLILGGIVSASSRTLRLGLWIQAAALAVLGAVAVAVLLSSQSLGSPFVDGIRPTLGLDPLSGFFLFVVAATSVPVLIFASGYLVSEPRRGVLGALTGAFIVAMCLVICARDISTFLAGWELMTLIPAVAILVHRSDRGVRNAVLVYLGVTHLGGVGVWLCLIMLSHAGVLSAPAVFGHQTAAFQWTIWIAAIIGFGVKAGVMPVHIWLPRAHPVAPSHLSALMSGVMLKVAIYGLIRVLFFWAAPAPTGIAVLLLVLGALSALGGVLYALFQHQLKSLLAFHSIENVGIILLGLGAAMLLTTADQPVWASIAFAAALLHTLNHAVFKSLLFLGGGAVQRSTHRLGIDHLGGLIKRMPWTGACFIVGAMAIVGLPPLNGFVSEWLTLQSLIHVAFDTASVPWIGPLVAAVLAATAALAVLCFVKVVGLIFLGAPHTHSAETATEVGWEMRLGQVLLAAMCGLLGILPALALPYLARLRGVVVELPTGLKLALPGTGGLPMPAVAVALCVVTALLLWLRGRQPTAPIAPTWVCGQEVEPDLAWTSAAFTKPLRMSWDLVLRPTRQVDVRRSGGLTQAVKYRGEVEHVFDTKVYEPAASLTSRAFARARKLQTGRLRNYAMYLVITLVLLLVLARLGVSG